MNASKKRWRLEAERKSRSLPGAPPVFGLKPPAIFAL